MKKWWTIALVFSSLLRVQSQSCNPVASISPSGTINICEGGSVSLTAPASNVWVQKADQLGIRYGAVAFSIGSKGYAGTGRDATRKKDFWEYDPATNVWTQKADFGGTARYFGTGFSVNGKGYIGTGRDAGGRKNDFWEYDPATNTWTQKANFGGTARDYAVGFSIGNKGYIGTGTNGAVHYKDFWEYNPATNSWSAKANFGGTARVSAVGIGIGGKGYIGTGYDGAEKKDFWEFDPVANGWTQKADFGGTAREAAAGFSIGARGFIGGGWDGGADTKDFWEYDPATDTWTQKADFGGNIRELHTGFSIGAKGYMGTGWDGTYKKDIWEYDPGYTYAWSTGQSTQFITVSTYGNYTLTLTNILGCSHTSAATVVNLSNTWTGGGTNNWNTASNWSCGTVPNSPGVNAVINNGASPMPVLNNDISIRNLTLNGTSTVTLNGHQFTIGGSISGGGSITGSAASSLVLQGAAGNVNFTSGAQTLQYLELGSGASANLNNTLNISAGVSAGAVTVNSGAVLNTGDNLVLQSDAQGTARIAASTGTINGAVTIERYIPARRAWRLLSVPLHPSAGTTISEAWQEAQQATTIPPPAYTPGSGTLITYSTSAVNGYDKGSTNNPSLKYFNGSNWAAPASTNIPVTNYPGYMLFVRGDRNFIIGGTNVPAASTTLRPRGPVNVGTQTINNLVGTGFQVVGNPFASAINFHTVTRSGLDDTYYLWDPKLGGTDGVGGFVTFAWNSGTNSYDQTINGSGSTSLPDDGTIESGAAFVVNFTGPGNLQIKETDKIATSSAAAFGRPVAKQQTSITAVLEYERVAGEKAVLDGLLLHYDTSLTDKNNIAAVKLKNFTENIAISHNEQLLAIERRRLPQSTDTVLLHLSQLRLRTYSLVIKAAQLQETGCYLLLEDSYTGTKTLLPNAGGGCRYTFTVTMDTASYKPNRLRLLLKRNPSFVSPFVFNSITVQKGRLEWQVNQQPVAGVYIIERSGDGVEFTMADSTNADEQTPTQHVYENSSIGSSNFYRIQFRPYLGNSKYSAVVNTGKAKSNFSIAPNPVQQGELQVALNHLPAGHYTVRLVNSNGAVLQQFAAVHGDGNAVYRYALDTKIIPGIYIAELLNGASKKAVQKIFVQ